MDSWLRSLTARRAIAIAIGPGILAVGFDAWISHLVGKPLSHSAQYVPVAYAAIAAVLVMAAAIPRLAEPVFIWTMRIMGVLGVLVGVSGTWFHVRWLVESLEEPVTREALEELLPVAPPIFAPAAFAGIGVLLLALGSRSLIIRLRTGAHDSSDATENVVTLRSDDEAPTGTGGARSS